MYSVEGNKTKYNTTIEVSKVVDRTVSTCDEMITGFTDKSFWYNNCPAGGIFEDKSIAVCITEPKNEAEVLVEMKGFVEDFMERCAYQPMKFVGILTNSEQFR